MEYIILICISVLLSGIILLHVCLLLSEKPSHKLKQKNGSIVVPTPIGAGRRARRTQRRQSWKILRRKTQTIDNQHGSNEIKLELPCQRYWVFS